MAHLSIIVKPSADFDVAVTDTEGVYLNDQFSRACIESVVQGLLERKALNDPLKTIGDPRDVVMQPLDFGPGCFEFTPIDVGLSTASWSVDLRLPDQEGLARRLHVGRFEHLLETFEGAMDQVYQEPASGEVVAENFNQP